MIDTGVEGEKEWKEEGERKEAQKGLQDYLHQLYVVARESLLMAPLMPGAYMHAFLALPRGLAAANAAATIYCVDGGKAPCVAKTTAALVRMGQLPLIRDTVAVACEGGRADVVAAVTMALLALREVCIVTQINNALVSAGQLAAGAKITGCMAQTVGSDIARMAREAGAKLLPGIFSEDKGEKAPKTGGAKASQAIKDGDPAAAAEAALEASADDPAVRPGPQAATGGRDPDTGKRARGDVELAARDWGPQKGAKEGYEAEPVLAEQRDNPADAAAGKGAEGQWGGVLGGVVDDVREMAGRAAASDGTRAPALHQPAPRVQPAHS